MWRPQVTVCSDVQRPTTVQNYPWSHPGNYSASSLLQPSLLSQDMQMTSRDNRSKGKQKEQEKVRSRAMETMVRFQAQSRNREMPASKEGRHQKTEVDRAEAGSQRNEEGTR